MYDHTAWLDLVRKQINRTLDDGIASLGKQGAARRVVFPVTLLACGYSFVSQATVPECMVDRKHQSAVYRRFQALQGACIPVFLGAVDMVYWTNTPL